MTYYRPILRTDPGRPPGAFTLAGGWCWFTEAEALSRDRPARFVPAADIPEPILRNLTAPRADVAGLSLNRPRIMGILNVTPDSFSDGGRFAAPEAAVAQALRMVEEGADLIDIGGESTRPGADTVPEAEEVARTAPVIAAIRAASPVPISIDTRKGAVARAALDAGAGLVNDVAALTFDPGLGQIVADAGVPVCLMHAQGDPKTMHLNPSYANVVLDVFDFLSERVEAAVALGIPRARIVVDPGIGFGKTLQHNVTLLRALALYHGLGCAVLLGASRKRFIGTLSGVEAAADRLAGSLAVALFGAAQGVQILRVHDTKETRQALSLQQALSGALDP